MVVVGSIVGAGFASGKEIASFFGGSGFWSIAFVLLVGALFFCCFFLFAKIGKMLKPNSISDINKAVFGKTYVVADLLCITSAFITLSSMLAGCDSLGSIVFGQGYNFCYISIAFAMIVAVLITFGIGWIYKVNNILIPIVLTLIFVVGVAFLIFVPKQNVSAENINFMPFSTLLSCFLYVAMNVFANIFIIAKSSQNVNKKKFAVASILTSVILSLFIVLILICILLGGDKIFLSDMPMLNVAYSINNVFGVVYSIVMSLAIFTTICNAAYTIQMWLNNFIPNKFLCSVITLVVGFAFSRFGFSTIVEVFYPLEGIFAFVLIVCCAIYYFKNQKKFKTQKHKNELKLKSNQQNEQ